jgi:hypothetical protein
MVMRRWNERSIASLNNESQPVLNFPADILTQSPSFSHAGATVNGIPSRVTFSVPKEESSRWRQPAVLFVDWRSASQV